MQLALAKPTARDDALAAIAAASRDPMAKRRRERAGLDIPDQPVELTDETRAELLAAATVSITFPRPPKWWQITKRWA